MTKRNINVLGIVLILLIAIGITIVLSGGATLAAASTHPLHSHMLNLEPLNLQQANVEYRILDESALELKSDLNLLTASASVTTLRPDLSGYLQEVALTAVRYNHLDQLLLTV